MAGGGNGFTPETFSLSRKRQRILPLAGLAALMARTPFHPSAWSCSPIFWKAGHPWRRGRGTARPTRASCASLRRSAIPSMSPRSATGLGAVGRRVGAPARRSAGTTRPTLSRGSRRGRSRRLRSHAASARPAAAPSATRPNRGGGYGGTRRHRRRYSRRRAPRLRSRPVPRARRRCALRAGTRLRRSARSAFCRRARGPACSSRPGCTQGPSPAAAAR